MPKNANGLANGMMPLMNAVGYLQYVIVAILGGYMAVAGLPNLSLTGIGTLSLGMIASFLTLSRNFTNPITQISNQFNSIVMALAGAERIFAFMDEQPETDDGYVTLVNAREVKGQLVETAARTGLWAWKHPHGDGTITYTKLEGRVVFDHVDFGYTPEKRSAARHHTLRRAWAENCFRRRDGRGQNHHHEPHQPLLRHRGRQNPL